jgi:short subunit dehydrogenase-like uncharacterized protein
MISGKLLLYGSYGYTGQLIADVCLRENISVILSGRDEEKLRLQSRKTGYPFQVCLLDEKEALRNLVSRAKVVIHCAGPFQYTAEAMAQACLDTGVHYTDITGEYRVFELLAGYDEPARQRGIMIMAGTGFDVVPTDCLAVFLKQRLPDATHLQLAFAALKGGISRGTRKTMIEGLGYDGMIRQNHALVPTRPGDKIQEVNFGPFTSTALCIPWGDISTAWRSTGIPNIEVYAAASPAMIRWARRSRHLAPLLRNKWVKKILLRQADNPARNPDPEKLRTGRSYIWGKVWNERGDTVEARLETLNGYLLTAETSVRIAQKILKGHLIPGYQTPARVYGADFILEINGTVRH